MLVAIDDGHALYQDWSDRDRPVFVRVDAKGRTQRMDFADARCRVYEVGENLLLERSADSPCLVEPKRGFVCSPVAAWDGRGEEPRWTFATLGRLFDTGRLCSREYAYDRDALKLPDPGYSEPVDACLLPNGDEVAINIVRCRHIAIFNFRTGVTELLDSGGSYGSGCPRIVGEALWFTNYDRLCRLDRSGRTLAVSEVLQPSFRDPKYGAMTSAFIGEPKPAPAYGGWLVPRPYSGDVVLVDSNTLRPSARIACGGRPYEIALLPDGTLIVADHPDGSLSVRTMDRLLPI